MWFSDDGGAPAVGRITPNGQISEFSARLQTGSQPALLAPAADGELWFTDEGTAAAIGTVSTGAPAALTAPPAVAGPVAGSPRRAGPLRCRAARWATWAHLQPSSRLFSFDGYQWLRDGAPIAGQHADHYAPAAPDRDARLSCGVTVTYPRPLLVSASGTSAAITLNAADR
jgi:hypothetical protein